MFGGGAVVSVWIVVLVCQFVDGMCVSVQFVCLFDGGLGLRCDLVIDFLVEFAQRSCYRLGDFGGFVVDVEF